MRRIDEAWDETLRVGGGTFELTTLEDVHAEAWAVGLIGWRLKADEPAAMQLFRLAYHDTMKRADRGMYRGLRLAFGTWVDDGTAYVDLVALIKDRRAALELAREHDQLAIYHLGTEETVYTQEAS